MPLLQNKTNAVKTFVIIHVALLAGQVLFAAVAFMLNQSTVFYLHKPGETYLIMAPLLTAVGYYGSRYLFNKQLENAASHQTIQAKLNVYKSGMIIRYALLEGPSLFCITCYLVTGNMAYFVFTGIIVLYFMTLWPSKERIASELNLRVEDAEKIEGMSV